MSWLCSGGSTGVCSGGGFSGEQARHCKWQCLPPREVKRSALLMAVVRPNRKGLLRKNPESHIRVTFLKGFEHKSDPFSSILFFIFQMQNLQPVPPLL